MRSSPACPSRTPWRAAPGGSGRRAAPRRARAASGFLYFVSVLGTTGARAALPRELPELVGRVRRVSRLPVGVGFGVSTPEQAGWIAGFADAVIVGSAIGRLVEEGDARGAPARVAAFVGAMRTAMHAARRPCVGG